jgi:hypothetical protein
LHDRGGLVLVDLLLEDLGQRPPRLGRRLPVAAQRHPLLALLLVGRADLAHRHCGLRLYQARAEDGRAFFFGRRRRLLLDGLLRRGPQAHAPGQDRVLGAARRAGGGRLGFLVRAARFGRVDGQGEHLLEQRVEFVELLPGVLAGRRLLCGRCRHRSLPRPGLMPCRYVRWPHKL